jgi:hypothetical protein
MAKKPKLVKLIGIEIHTGEYEFTSYSLHDRRAPGDKYARAFYAGRSDAEGNGWYSFNGGEVWARKSVLADWQNATVQEKEIAAVEAARRSRRERLKSAIAAVYRVDKGIKITVSKEK